MRACICTVVVWLLTAFSLVGCGGSARATKTVSASTAAQRASQTTKKSAKTLGPGASRQQTELNQSHGAENSTSTAATTSSVPARHQGHHVKPEEELGKTSFLQRTGRGFAAFHMYISNRLRKHIFSRLGVARSAAIVKGVTAATFAAHELHAASVVAKAEQAVAHLARPLQEVSERMNAIAIDLEAGKVNVVAIVDARCVLYKLGSRSKRFYQSYLEDGLSLFLRDAGRSRTREYLPKVSTKERKYK
jgi:hypothetical protein